MAINPLSHLSRRRQASAPEQPSNAQKVSPLDHLRPRQQPSLKQQADNVARAGRYGDDAIIHLNRRTELPVVDAVLKALQGAGTRNPRTGEPEYWASSDGNHMQGGGGSPSAGGSASGKGSQGGSNGGARNNGLSDQDITSGTGWNDNSSGATITRDRPPSTSPGGGTYTSFEYTPGAVPNVPDGVSPGQIAGTFSSAIPGVGAANGAATAVDGMNGGDFSSVDGGPLGRLVDAMFGASPGPQRGWAPDRDHGVANGLGGASDGTEVSSTNSPLRMLRMVPTQQPDAYAALLASLQNPKVFSSSDPVIVR